MTIEKQKLILENSGYYLSDDTLEKLNKGYKKASSVLSEYIGNGKIIITKKSGSPEKTEEIQKPIKPFYISRTEMIKGINKGYFIPTRKPTKDSYIIGYATNSGMKSSKLIGTVYNNNIVTPEPEYYRICGL